MLNFNRYQFGLNNELFGYTGHTGYIILQYGVPLVWPKYVVEFTGKNVLCGDSTNNL
jgi:hypothetical protein